MIIFKLDDERRSRRRPLLTKAIHLLNYCQLKSPSEDPLVISLDEFPPFDWIGCAVD